MQTISCNNHYSAIFNRQSLIHPTRVEQSIYKPKKSAPQANTSLRSLNSNSSHFSKNIKNINDVNNINVKRKEQLFSKNLILKNGTFCTINPKKRFRDDENSNKSFTARDPNSAENNSCLANPKKRSKTHDSMQKNNAENFRVVKNSSDNSNSKENNSHSANPKKRCIEATTRNSVQGNSNTRTANPNKCFKEAGSKCSTTHNSAQRNGIENNLRTANLKKCPREIERSNRSSTTHSPVQRKSTECPSCLVNRSKKAEGLKKAPRVRFDQFSCKAMNTRAKNKELNESEWEDIRLIKVNTLQYICIYIFFVTL
jgi:hypothetical protein